MRVAISPVEAAKLRTFSVATALTLALSLDRERTFRKGADYGGADVPL